MTLYRTSGDSPIVQSLIRAAERGKQVVVLVEIKARFDEEANIVWARKLEQRRRPRRVRPRRAQDALQDRRSSSGARAPGCAATSTSGPATTTRRRPACTSTSGLLTCRPEIGADVTDLFNVLTGLSRQRTFRRLLVAPHSLRSRFLQLVEREVRHAQAGREARIVLKLNAIVDVPSIEALYERHGRASGST